MSHNVKLMNQLAEGTVEKELTIKKRTDKSGKRGSNDRQRREARAPDKNGER
jgi:hypothetical protein